MQDLGGGIWRGLRYLAGAVVTSFRGEVNAAVNGSVRKHSSGFISLPWHWWQHICSEHKGMKQFIDAREAWKYQGLRWKINVPFCTFAFQLRQVHEPTKGRWCTTIAKLSASVTGLPLVLHVSLPKTIFFFFSPIPSTVKVKFGIFLYWRMFSIVHFMSEPMKLSGLQWNDERNESTNHSGNFPRKYVAKLLNGCQSSQSKFLRASPWLPWSFMHQLI